MNSSEKYLASRYLLMIVAWEGLSYFSKLENTPIGS